MTGREVRVLFTAGPGIVVWPSGVVQVEATVPTAALYSLGAVVEAAGFPCTLLDPVDYWRLYRSDADLAAFAAGHTVVCVSANSLTWPTAVPLIRRFARLEPRPLVVVGGLHPTLCDAHVLAGGDIDIVVRGEGEATLPELLRAVAAGSPLEEVPGLSLWRDGAVLRTAERPLLTPEELAAQPLPLWDRLPAKVYGFIPIETSRGCRFGCSFCSIYHKHSWRPLEAAAVRGRVVHAMTAVERVNYPTLMFSDDCFTSDPGRVEAIAEVIREVAPNVGVGIEARAPDVLDPRLTRALSRMNVEFLQVGVECGYPEGLRRIHKGITLDDVIASAHLLHRAGLRTEVKYSYIVGFPWETLEDMKRTLAFAMSLGSRYGNHVQVNWLLVVPGSEIHAELAAKGRVHDEDFDALPDDRLDLFARNHPMVDNHVAAEVHDFAAFMEATYPWVSTLGNVFRFWTTHPHLPVDRTTPVPPWRLEPARRACAAHDCWSQLPEVLRAPVEEMKPCAP